MEWKYMWGILGILLKCGNFDVVEVVVYIGLVVVGVVMLEGVESDGVG